MTNAVFGYNNYIDTAGLVAGSEAAGLSISQLKVPQGSTAASWQTATGVKTAAAGANFTIDAGSDATWQAFLLARTSLTPSAQIRWRVGDPSGWTAVSPSLDIDLTASPSMTGWTTTRSGAGAGEATYVDSSGNLATATGSQFRFTHDAHTLEPLGLLWEPARTNYCRNPRLVGAAVLSAGTMPTGWSVGAQTSATIPAGLTAIVIGGGTSNGVGFTDFRIFGVPTGPTPVVRIRPEISGDGITPSITAAVGESWNMLVNLQTSANYLNTPVCNVGIEELNGSTPLVSSFTTFTPSTSGTTLATDRTHARVLTSATTNRVVPFIDIAFNQNVACDMFIRVGNVRMVKSAVNYVTNPSGATGRVLGSSGTHPTRAGWSFSTPNFIPTVVATGTENGMTYVDYRIVGNTAVQRTLDFLGDSSLTGTTGLASVGSVWTYSVAAKFANSNPVNPPIQHAILLNDISTTSVTTTRTVSVALPAASSERLTAARTAGTFSIVLTDTNIVRGGQRFTIPPGSTDFILRIAVPQLEAGASSTSPILQSGVGTTATTTRPADGSNLTITALTDYSIAVEGMVASAPTAAASSSPLGTVSLYSATTTNGFSCGPVFLPGASAIKTEGSWWNPSAAFSNFSGGSTITVGQVFRIAAGYTTGSQGAAANGEACAFSTSPGTHGATLNRLSLTPAAAGSICYRRLRLFDTRLVDGRLVTGLSSTGTTLNLGAVSYDSGWSGAGVEPGYGQTFRFAPHPVTGRYVLCEIDDPSNPDGFIAVGLAYAGPVWQPEMNIGWETTTNTDVRIDEVVTHGGQEFPQYRFEQRRWDVAMQHILDSEIWSSAAEVQRAGRRGGNVLFAPDPTSENVQKEAVFGRVYSQSDIEYSNNTTQYRSWRLRVVERL